MLIRGVWDIFEAQWACRNDILHAKENALTEKDKHSITGKLLLDFKRHNLSRLRRCDRHFIDNYSVEEVIKWPLPRKKATLDLLSNLNKLYVRECKKETASYRDIASYFTIIPKDSTPQEASEQSSSSWEGTEASISSPDLVYFSSSSSSSEEEIVVRRAATQRSHVMDSIFSSDSSDEESDAEDTGPSLTDTDESSIQEPAPSVPVREDNA